MSIKKDLINAFVENWRRECPELDASPLGVFGRISRLSSHFTRRCEQWLAPLGLNWETFSVIVTLRRCGKPFELKPGDLLNVSLLTSGAITNRIDRVEEMGLLTRLPDANDRRGVIVRLTPKGVRLAEEAIAVHFRELRKLLDPLTGRERDQLAKLLMKLLLGFEDGAASGASKEKASAKVSDRVR